MTLERKTELIVRLLWGLLFVGLAIWQFIEGNQTNGILWLILTQLYDMSQKK